MATSTTTTTPPQFLVVTFPGQGHINPSLQFSKRLLHFGARVTFVTAAHAYRRMADSINNAPPGLSFATFSDGHDDGGPTSDTDVNHYMATLERRGSQTLRDLIIARDRTTFTCVFYTVLMPWVADVATSLDIPSTLVWIQPATVFCIYYYYFNGYEQMLRNAMTASSEPAQLPGLPLSLIGRDIPSFLGPNTPYSFSLPLLKRHFDILRTTTTSTDNNTVLINTFDALEADALKAIETLNLKGIGPLIPSAFLDNEEDSGQIKGDLFKPSEEMDYIEWLNSKPKGSVIYVSFGSISVLSEKQEEEMARGLLGFGKPFLWVIRNDDNKRVVSKDVGLIVPWCSQMEVLCHGSVGCFVTHCGWNSTLESLVCGVPVVGFPQWSDQHTNAKLIEDMWGTGVRVVMTAAGDEGGVVVPAEEIIRCLELVVNNGEMKDKAQKWRQLAIQASKEGGSSHNNLRSFMNEIIGSN